jgi:predicted nucleic acid-binding protein
VIWVVDASAAVELLLRTSIGLRIEPIVFRDRTLAPELLDAEVLAVIRREHLHGRLDGVRAREAIDDLAAWDLERLPHRPLLPAAWGLRNNVSAYDALYVAAAQLHNATLLTAHGPLSRASGIGVGVQNVRSL